MRKNLLAILIFITIASCQTKKKLEIGKEIINLPLTIVEGFGPFEGYATALHPEHTLDNPNGAPWVKTYLSVQGVPKTWRKVVKSMVWLNAKQLVYQNFRAGKISREMYEHLQKSWKWVPVEEELSAKPVKCYVYVVRGIDAEGKMAAIIDQNNNLDFSDEKPFYPEKVTTKNWNASYANTHKVNYEIYREGKILTAQIPMLVKYVFDYSGDQYWYCFPQYATTALILDGKQYNIAIQGGFDNPDYNIAEIVLTNNVHRNTKYALGQGIVKGELLTLNDINKVKYENLGVNIYHNVLQLKGVAADKIEYSNQVGYLFKPFEAVEFTTGEKLTLDTFRGKYLLIDFWGTWCKGCVEALPELVRIFKSVDKEKVAFLSIAGHDNKESLTKFLRKRPIPWSLALSDSVNKLIEQYHIEGFPTVLLIGPDGRVVAKNPDMEELKAKLSEVQKKAIEEI